MFSQVWLHVGAPGEPKSGFIYFPGVLCDLLSRLEVPVCASVWWVGRVCLGMPVKEQAWWAQENRRKKRQKFIMTWRKSIPGDFLLLYGHWRKHTLGSEKSVFLSPNLKEEGGNTSSSVLCFLKSVCESDWCFQWRQFILNCRAWTGFVFLVCFFFLMISGN